MSGVAKRTLRVVDGNGPPPGGGTPDVDDWKRLLTRNRNDQIEGTLHNLCTIIENDASLCGTFWLDESSAAVVMDRDTPWTGGNRYEFTDIDGGELAAWLQHPDRYRMATGADAALQAVITVARRHARHPIRDYVQALQWDGTPRVETMLIDLFGCEDRLYNRQAAVCFMVSAVARLLWADPKQPQVGAKVDFMLVLEGPQGKKKSTALQTLFGANWYVETHESPSKNDFFQIIRGCWGVEIAEMDSFNKADVTSVKTAITRRVDKFRAPYERMPRSYRRECVFVGTTNETEYLRDHTGGRRFLPVRVAPDGEINIDGITAERDQLWAEAAALFRAGTQWWTLPDDAPAEQEDRYTGDSWEDRVARWLAKKAPGENAYPHRLNFEVAVGYTTTDEILQYAIGVDAARHDRPSQMRVAAIMKRLEWRQQRCITESGYRERRWVRVGSGNDPGGPPDVPF